MRGILGTISTYAIFGGLVMSFFAGQEYLKVKNLSSEPQAMNLESVSLEKGKVSYVSIPGGFLDLENAYEYQLESKSGSSLGAADVYIPVTNESGDYKYTLKVKDDEGIEATLDQNAYTGLLESGTEMPSDLQETYSGLYTGKELLQLDAEYEPGQGSGSLNRLLLFLGLIGLGVIIKVLLGRSNEQN